METVKKSLQKPTATMKFIDVLIRIRGKVDIFGPESSESRDVLATFTLIREKAINDEIVVFGRKEWRMTRAEDLEILAPRIPIPIKHWEDHVIDYTVFANDRLAITENNKTIQDTKDTYGDLWFDKNQVDTIWPAPKQTIKEWIKSKLCPNG